MTSRTRCTMMSSALCRSRALLTSCTMRRRASSMVTFAGTMLSAADEFAVAHGELLHGAAIDLAFERHHLTQRVPVADPAPAVELRTVTAPGETHRVVLSQHSQQKPLLLLTDADRAAFDLAHQPFRQAVAQP